MMAIIRGICSYHTRDTMCVYHTGILWLLYKECYVLIIQAICGGYYAGNDGGYHAGNNLLKCYCE